MDNPKSFIRSNDSGTNPDMKFGFGQVSGKGISFKLSNSIINSGKLPSDLILSFTCSKDSKRYDLFFKHQNCQDFTCPCPLKANCSLQKD